MGEKRYYWMRLPADLFNSKRIKKLRKCAGGDTYFVIYLKMQLKSITSGGVLYYDGLEDSFAEEIASDIEEDVINVEFVLDFLEKYGLAEFSSDRTEMLLPFARDNTGSESAVTQRSRECRKRKRNAELLQLQQNCNTTTFQCNDEPLQTVAYATKNVASDCKCNDEPLQCNENATQVQRDCNVEIEKSKRTETSIVIDTEIRREEGCRGEGNQAPETAPPVDQGSITYDSHTQNSIDYAALIRFYLKLGKNDKANHYYTEAKKHGIEIDVEAIKAEVAGASGT